MAGADEWPSLPVAEWRETRDTLHRWTQVVGKIRLALAPMVNHWWQVPLYVSARGLTTSAIPAGRRRFEIDFDFCRHELHIDSSDPDRRTIALEPKSVAEFHREVMAALADLGLEVEILARPVEVSDATPFADDEGHRAYDPDCAQRFWRLLVHADRVLTEFRSRFIGKVSPVHFFWGGFDLAVTRFSGREAPVHPGGYPNVGDWVMREAIQPRSSPSRIRSWRGVSKAATNVTAG